MTGNADLNADVNFSERLPTDVEINRHVPIALTQPIQVNLTGLNIEYEGTFISEPLFGQINENDSQEFVQAVFGKSDFKTKLGDGTVIWRWNYRPKGQGGPLLSIFGGKSDEPRPDHITVIVTFRDGKVIKKWRG